MRHPGIASAAAAVFLKDAVSELRTRYALNALFLFAVTSVCILLFAFRSAPLPAEAHAGLIWVLIFFGAMTGMSRAFVSEEDRGTVTLLRLSAPAGPVFAGKLLFNAVLLLALAAVLTSLYALLVPGFAVAGLAAFVTALGLGTLGLAAASTIIGALIARAEARGPLYPVLSFPVVLPLLLTAIRATSIAMERSDWAAAGAEYRVLAAYIVAVATASWLVFEIVWRE